MASFNDEEVTDELDTVESTAGFEILTWDNEELWDGAQTWNGLFYVGGTFEDTASLDDEEITETLSFTIETL
jgi:hypothetical protein